MADKFNYKGYNITIYPVDLKKNTGFMGNVNIDTNKIIRLFGSTKNGLKQEIINKLEEM